MGSSDGSKLGLGVVLLLIGAVALGTVAADVSAYNDRVGSAAETEGRIVEEPQYYESGDDDTTEYTVRVRYRYSVEGQTYTGSTVWPDGSNTFTSVDRVDEFVRNHSENSSVTVYYQPSNPEQSFLRTGNVGLVIARNVGATVGGATMLFLGLSVVAVTLWRRRGDS